MTSANGFKLALGMSERPGWGLIWDDENQYPSTYQFHYLIDKEEYPMTRVQFGWLLPSGPSQGMSRNTYMESVHKGFELIKGHFDSLWFVDHLQSENNPLLEGWTVLAYPPACQWTLAFSSSLEFFTS